MLSFEFHNPTHIVFGDGSLAKAGDAAKECGDRVVVMLGRSHASDTGTLGSLRGILRRSGVDSVVMEGIEPNPRLSTVVAMASELRARSPSCILALGGGSVMDGAKPLSLVLTHDGDPWEYRITGAHSIAGIEDCLIPVITIPTTAGTGCEISPAAVVTHESKKEVYFSPYMFPRTAIVDPALALSLPRDLTAQTGMDAFVQSLEAFVSTRAHPFSDMFAVRSMQLTYDVLPEMLDNLSDVRLRSLMSLAGLLSCYAIGMAGVGAAHALSDPLSGRYDIGHGLAVSILLPSVMRANREANLDKFASLASYLGHARDEADKEAAAELGVSLVEELLAKLGLTSRLSDFGIEASEFPIFAEEADNPDMSTNPKKLSREQLVAIYEQVL